MPEGRVTVPRVGVLSLQGDFREHSRMIATSGGMPVEVRLPEDLIDLDALIIPGGESTTIGRLAGIYDLIEPLQQRIRAGLPTLGTCAGMILLASRITEGNQPLLGILDMVVQRNAFGRQNQSFESDLEVAGWEAPLRAVFIRAPAVEKVGPEIEILARYASRPVLVRDGHVLACAFHPELTEDRRIHEMLITLIDRDR